MQRSQHLFYMQLTIEMNMSIFQPLRITRMSFRPSTIESSVDLINGKKNYSNKWVWFDLSIEIEIALNQHKQWRETKKKTQESVNNQTNLSFDTRECTCHTIHIAQLLTQITNLEIATLHERLCLFSAHHKIQFATSNCVPSSLVQFWWPFHCFYLHDFFFIRSAFSRPIFTYFV